MKFFTLLSLSLTSFLFATAQDITFVRHPALSPDGSQMAFSYQGDIWIMATAEDAVPRRLTLHEAYESRPVFNADGNYLAFTGNRFGHDDIFRISVKGGNPERLTFHQAADEITDWDERNQIWFSTVRNYKQVEWDSEIHLLDLDNPTPYRAMDALGEQAVVSPNGRYVAFVKGACRFTRENYSGPADNEIWIYDREKENYFAFTDNEVNDLLPRWRNDQELFYLSALDGRYAVVSKSMTDLSAAPQKRFAFPDKGIQHFDLAGEQLVLAANQQLYLAALNGKPRALNLTIPTDYRFYPVEKKTFGNNASDYAIAPDGKTVALQIRGDIFVRSIDPEKSATRNLTEHPFYDRGQAWLNDSVLFFNSDRQENRYALYSARSADPDKGSLLKTLKRKISLEKEGTKDWMLLSLSPERKKAVYKVAPQKYYLADVNNEGGLENERLLSDDWYELNGLSWSPDGRYLAYYRADLNFNSEVYIQDTDGGEPVNVSMHPGGDYRPSWSADGSKLGFVSDRNDNDADLWFVWLKEEDWLASKDEREEGYYFEEEEAELDSADEKLVEIDFANIHDRLEQVTRLSGGEYNYLIDEKGELFYFLRSNPGGSSVSLYQVKYDGSELKEVSGLGARVSGLRWGPDYKYIYYLSSGVLHRLDLQKKKTEAFPHKAVMTLDKRAERAQVFNEAWKTLGRRFYDPDFHGEDWEALGDEYREWALAATTTQDFRYIFSLMLGRLNASHLGIYGQDPEETQRDRPGLLGFEVKPIKKGVEVSRVVPRAPADRPRNKLEPGDKIVAVNSKAIEGNFYQLLSESAEERYLFELGDGREVVIEASKSLRTALYEEWLNERQELTEQYSGGRLGYIHIRGMDKPSFERFERELMVSGYGKEGIVIDVRYNGGGWTTDYLLAVLSVRQHAYTVPRGATDDLKEEHPQFSEYYPYSERLPLSGYTRPTVAMCNESSYSNAEIFSHAYKSLDLGTLVGQPTFGAVISTGGTRLLDGSFLRLPFRGWYVKNTGQNMENGPAVPDVIVSNPLDYRGQKKDPQLKKAVEVLLEQLDN